MWKRNFVLMDQAGGEADKSGGGGGDAGAAAAAAAAAAAGGDKGGAAAGDKSLLAAAGDAGSKDAAAKAAAAAAAAADPNGWVPEKYRVFVGEGDAKKLDLEQSAKKVAAAHGELEKRMGTLGAPPEKAEGYKTEGALDVLRKAATANGKEMPPLPEGFVKEFNTWAHAAGLSQAQYDKTLPALMGFVPALMEQAFDNQKASATKELVKVWGADGMKPESEQMQDAYNAFKHFAPEKLRSPEGMDQIGNHPIVLQVLAAVGKEMREDKRISGEGAQADNVHALMRTESYWNKKHPEHQATVRKVNDFFAAGGKVAAKAA